MEQFIFLVIGVFIGALIMLYVVFRLAPGYMLQQRPSEYGFDETLERLQNSVDSLEWKTPHVHDLKATLNKFGYDVKRVHVMEICKPEYANMILSRDDERIASAMMPCRIAVYEKSDGSVYVSLMNGKGMGNLFGGIIKDAMKKAGDESEIIVKSIS